jgi:hypothetical protein
MRKGREIDAAPLETPNASHDMSNILGQAADKGAKGKSGTGGD